MKENLEWMCDLHKTLDVPQLSIRVDDLFLRLEALVATSAGHRLQAHAGGAGNSTKVMKVRKFNSSVILIF